MNAPIHIEPEEVWDRLPLSATAGPLSLAMSPEEQEIRLDALGNRHPWYRTVSPFGAPVFLPTFFLTLYFDLQESAYVIPRMIHAKAEIETFEPCGADTRFVATWRVTDKYERRGGRYLVTEAEFRDEDGELVARLRNTFLLNSTQVYAQKAEP